MTDYKYKYIKYKSKYNYLQQYSGSIFKKQTHSPNIIQNIYDNIDTLKKESKHWLEDLGYLDYKKRMLFNIYDKLINLLLHKITINNNKSLFKSNKKKLIENQHKIDELTKEKDHILTERKIMFSFYKNILDKKQIINKIILYANLYKDLLTNSDLKDNTIDKMIKYIDEMIIYINHISDFLNNKLDLIDKNKILIQNIKSEQDEINHSIYNFKTLSNYENIIKNFFLNHTILQENLNDRVINTQAEINKFSDILKNLNKKKERISKHKRNVLLLDSHIKSDELPTDNKDEDEEVSDEDYDNYKDKYRNASNDLKLLINFKDYIESLV